MSTPEALLSVAKQLRSLAVFPRSGSLDGAGRLTEEAIRLGAFAGPEFVLLRRIFEPGYWRGGVVCCGDAFHCAADWLATNGHAGFVDPGMIVRVNQSTGQNIRAMADLIVATGISPSAEPLTATADLIVATGISPSAEPLTDTAERVFQIIKDQGPVHGKKICSMAGLEQSTLTKHIIPVLKAKRGVRNAPGSGYYLP